MHGTCRLKTPAEDVINWLELPVDLPMLPLVGQQDETKKRLVGLRPANNANQTIFLPIKEEESSSYFHFY